jgi:hypothetical protein
MTLFAAAYTSRQMHVTGCRRRSGAVHNLMLDDDCGGFRVFVTHTIAITQVKLGKYWGRAEEFHKTGLLSKL